jgi:biotin-(acetyl-CoA carboxylase) ligase
MDIDSDGALILETAEGERKRIVAGDADYRKS